jgi:DNA-binding NarL/FixJ family response regulator
MASTLEMVQQTQPHKSYLAPKTKLTARIRVLVVDDHNALRRALVKMLSAREDIVVIGEAADGSVATDLARVLVPDVILMDVCMLGMDGLQATKIIHSELPRIQIIALSMIAEPEFTEAMRASGAVRYLLKGCPADTIIEAILACMRPAKGGALPTSN